MLAHVPDQAVHTYEDRTSHSISTPVICLARNPFNLLHNVVDWQLLGYVQGRPDAKPCKQLEVGIGTRVTPGLAVSAGGYRGVAAHCRRLLTVRTQLFAIMETVNDLQYRVTELLHYVADFPWESVKAPLEAVINLLRYSLVSGGGR